MTNRVFLLSSLGLFTAFSAKSPAQKPNIVLILADDLGYSDIGCYGSEIPTPNIDRLAKSGKVFTQFYNQARSCPSRASLLTGLYPHQAGIGGMTEGLMYPDSTLIPSYIGYLNRSSVTLAEVLRENGYQTFMSGKWHVGDSVTQWPSARGFDKDFSLVWGCSNYFNTKPYLNDKQEIIVSYNGKPVQPAPGFYFTTEFTRYALQFIDEADDSKPFFLYLSYTAPHWPIQALDTDIAMFKGKYMMGWDSMRMERFERMKSLGIIPESTALSPKFENVPDWSTLSPEQKQVWDLRMAVYAAMIYRMDLCIGEVIAKLQDKGIFDNTIIIFLSDNGATNAEVFWATNWCADRSGATGTEKSFESYGKWANTSNTPFRKFKYTTYEGGIRTPFIFHWPQGAKSGLVSHYPGCTFDIMPTLLDIIDGQYPSVYAGNEITPSDGQSLWPLLQNQEQPNNRTLFWEHFGEKAIRWGDWKMVYNKNLAEWELYNLSEDMTEINDQSKAQPEIVKTLLTEYTVWAEKMQVVPDTLYKKLIMIRNADWFK